VIARHIADNVDFVSEAIFVPTDEELKSAAVHRTVKAKAKCTLLARLGGPPPNSGR